jgi:hypothetical protein
MVDAFAHLNVVDLTVEDDLTITDDLTVSGAFTLTGNADLNGDLDVDGTTNLDVVDIDGAVDFASTTAHAGNATFADNAKAIFGTDSDLQIYHDGSNSYISDQGTNDLKVLATDFQLKNAADTEFMMTAVTDGAVTFYHNNAAKLATTSSGIDVTGSVTANGGVVVDNITIDGNDISTTNSNGNLTITPNGTGNVNINSDTVAIAGTEGESASLLLAADESDDNADIWKITSNTNNTLTISNQISGSAVAHATFTPNATVASSTVAFAGAATFGSTVDATGGAFVKASSGASATSATVLTVEDDDNTELSILGGSSSVLAINFGHSGDNDEGKITFNTTAGSEDLQLVSSKEITLDAAGDIILDADGADIRLSDGGTQFGKFTRDSGDFVISSSENDKDMKFAGADGGADVTALTLDMSDGGTAIFGSWQKMADSNRIVFGAGSDLAIYSDGTDGNIDGASKIKLDAADEIHLDSDAGIIRIQDDAGDVGMFQMTNLDFIIRSMSSDKDLIFKGNDGGSVITALTLDMSAAGAATFNSSVTANPSGGVITLGTNGHITSKQSLDTVTAGGRYMGSSNRGLLGQMRIEQTANSADGGYIALDTSAVGSTSPTERMRIDSSGNVGIGGTPATARLEVTGAFAFGSGANSLATTVSKAATRIRGSSDASTSLFFGSLTNDAEQYIQSANGAGSAADDLVLNPYGGNVGIGHSSPNRQLSIQNTLANSGGVIGLTSSDSSTSGTFGIIHFGNSTDSSLASINGIADGSTSAGALLFKTEAAGGAIEERMRIRSNGEVDIKLATNAYGTFSQNIGEVGIGNFCLQIANSAGSALKPLGFRAEDIRFATGSSERGRFDSSGNLLVGTTNSSGIAGSGIKLTNPASPADDGKLMIVGATSTSGQDAFQIYSTGASAYRFFVNYAGSVFATSTSITAISDESLKQNIRDLDKGLDAVLELRPRRFDWKNGDGDNIMGFVAQEVEEVMPELVHDYKYSETETKLGLKMGDMIPTLVKAIQEQQILIETLQAEVAALKGA